MSFSFDLSPEVRDSWINWLIFKQYGKERIMVRAKFRCSAVHAPEWKGEGRQVTLQAVYGRDGSENAAWSKATPSGTITMFITNPGAYAAFEEGKEYYVDFEPAEGA